jgi:hypothetical protein
VLDARRAIRVAGGPWLRANRDSGQQLGSCLALLTTAHEPLIRAEALNHVSPHFADVVWRGLSTRHVREGSTATSSWICCARCGGRSARAGISNACAIGKTLLVYARYDLTFPPDLSEDLVAAFRELHIPHEVATLRCGHYTTARRRSSSSMGGFSRGSLKRALVDERDLERRTTATPTRVPFVVRR